MPSPTKQLADRLLADAATAATVDQLIADRRAEGCSWRRIALAIRDATSGAIDVTPETVRGWALAAERSEQIPA